MYEGNEEVVPAYVAAVGFDDKYLFVKQHPTSGEHEERVRESVTDYYLIERAAGIIANKENAEPYSEAAFNNLCKKLEIKDVNFSTQYPENI